jgi:hypothetical protein
MYKFKYAAHLLYVSPYIKYCTEWIRIRVGSLLFRTQVPLSVISILGSLDAPELKLS